MRNTAGEDQTPWAAYLAEVTSRPGWSVARLARESGIHRSTIFRWLAGARTGTTVESVRRIALAVGDDPDDAVRAATAVLSHPGPDDPDSAAIALVMESDLPDAVKKELVADLRRQAREDAERRRESVRRVLRIRHV